MRSVTEKNDTSVILRVVSNPREAKEKKNVVESRKHHRRAACCTTETLARKMLGAMVVFKVHKIVEISSHFYPHFNCVYKNGKN